MAALLFNPVFQFVNSAGAPYAGGSLTFYQTSSSIPLDTYPTDDLTGSPNANPVTLNSAGWPDVEIFLQNRPYKVVLKDSSGSEIWTRDPVYGTDFGSVVITKENAGSPNGVVAGTAASSGVLPTFCWDRTNSILYVCTTTGNAATAVWTALNASSATPVVVPPQGYLSTVVTNGNPILTADSTSATSVLYAPFQGNLVPVNNGARFVPTEFAELTLTLHSSHAANTIYDVFAFSNAGVVTLVTGPAWNVSTAGSGARGTGPSTTQISRVAGYWVNAVQIAGRNGSTTHTIGANLATYLGSIFIDGSAGQVTQHVAFGQNRKWGVWNAYNRQPLFLQAGDATASWTYNSATVRQSNGAAGNKLTVFSGLAEEPFDCRFAQKVQLFSSTGITEVQIGIGVNATNAYSGRAGDHMVQQTNGGATHSGNGTPSASHIVAPALGIQSINACESCPNLTGGAPTAAFFGGNDDMLLTAAWRA